MALTVFAEKMGFFHKGSAGIGIAPLDVCLSPPPGPVPIPYTNVLFAKDLIKGSKTVRIDGEPTFLEDYSETSTSIGDEGGTLGGSVVTGVILGKGYFMVWSMTIQIEGLGVCRHGDMMGQNSASSPPSSIDAAAIAKHSAVRAPTPGPVAARRAAQARVMQATGPGDSEPTPDIPCDFETIAITCSHSGERMGPYEYSYAGVIEDNLPRPKSNKKPFVPNIQVIAGPSDDEADAVTIELRGGPGYGCSKSHPHVVITDRSSGEKQKHHGKTKVELPARCKQVELPVFAYMSPAAVLAYFWFSPKTTRRYVIEVESCGVLADQNPGFRKLSRQLDVFASDTYEFSFSIPTVVNRAYQKSATKALEPNAKWVGGEDDGWDKKSAYNQGHPVREPIQEAGGSIELVRNGDKLKATATLGQIVKALASVQNQIQSVMNFIRDFQPQLGWKFGFEIGFFTGDLSLEWGAKEAEDHTVFRWWKFEANLTLLSLELEASFGVDFRVWKVFCVSALIFGKVSGEAKLDGGAEATPEAPDWEAKISASIDGELGIKAALGADWVAATGKFELGFPFEATASIDAQDGFGIDWKLEFSGLEAKLAGHIKFAGSFSKTIEIMPKRTLGSGRFPDGARRVAEIATP
ncbi:MAG: DUF4150 domain-containing protein [Enhygromyxa sp.]